MNISEFMNDKDEKPLDRIVSDGGYCRIFKKIAVIGDSLSTGTLESTDSEGNRLCHEFYDYSWVQHFSDISGCTMLNFSRGGMTAQEFCESFAEERGFWAPDKACQAYIIALGWNDFYGKKMEAGNLSEALYKEGRNNKTTFADWYVEIIRRYKAIQPDAKFFFITLPHSDNEEWESAGETHAKLLYSFATHFTNSYVLDIRKYGPAHDEEFKRKFFMGGHLTPCGYVLGAKIAASYIDYIIRHNLEYFKQTTFIGTPYKNTKA